MNLAWWLESATWEHGGKKAIIHGDETSLTYNELNGMANKIGNILKDDYDVQEDDRVCVHLPDDGWLIAIIFASFKIGAIYCGLNRGQIYDKFKYDISITKPKVLVTNNQFLESAKKLQQDADFKIILCQDSEGEYPNLKYLVKNSSDHLRIRPRANKDICIINFTAGTSGPSKGVILTHGTLGQSLLTAHFWYGLKASDTLLTGLPLFHTGGLNNVFSSILGRATIIHTGGWDAEKFISFLDKYKPDWLYLFVPTMVRDMARRERYKQLDLSNLKVMLAGEPVPEEVHQMLRKQGARTLCAYGMTEIMPFAATSSSFYYHDDDILPASSAGKTNKEFVEVKLVDPQTGKEIKEPDTSGEVLIRGDILTPGYYNNAEMTKENIDPDGWFHSKDMAYSDKDGWYFISGRTDDIINTGGEKLSLLEVEKCLLASPIVKDAACIGVPHDKFGYVPAAFIEPVDKNTTEEQLKTALDNHCKKELERWKRPRLYIKMEEIPRTMAKRTRDMTKLKKIIKGIEVKEADGVVTLKEIKKS